jgi:hypothetical protein
MGQFLVVKSALEVVFELFDGNHGITPVCSLVLLRVSFLVCIIVPPHPKLYGTM